MRHRIPFLVRLSTVVMANFGAPAQAWDMSYLQGLLGATPQGGWVQANVTPFSSAWAPPTDGGLPPGSYSDPGAIVRAWSGFAWDSSRGNMILWGGGHANYAGNEVYLWSAETGAWSRGSLPSRLISGSGISGAFPGEYLVVDGAAPQSAHTYENIIYAPVSDRMLVLGGAVFNTGGEQRVIENGVPVAAGIWQWDPASANSSKVGGTTGSGYLPDIVGGEMWSRRTNGANPPSYNSTIEATTAYRTEGGRDVIYQTRDRSASGFPLLYRLTLGGSTSGEADVWERVGVSSQTANYQASATLDLENNLYVRTAFNPANGRRGLGVWDLKQASALRPTNDTFINLAFGDGTPFLTNANFALSFDAVNSRFVLWDGSAQGTVYYVDSEFNPDGTLDNTWTVTMAPSSTSQQPNGNFNSSAGSLGVLGKWQYIPELGAFMALDMYSNGTQDAGAWLYKPFEVGAVPEPARAILMLLGAGVLLAAYRRRLQRH